MAKTASKKTAASKKVAAGKKATATATLPKATQIKDNDLVLRVEDRDTVFYVVRFEAEGATDKPVVLLLDPASPDHKGLLAEFESGLLLGIPARKGADEKRAFRFDPGQVHERINRWAKERADKHPGALADVGKYDILFSRTEEVNPEVPGIYDVKFTASGTIKPTGEVERVTNPTDVENIKEIFDGGTYLAFLQQIGSPTGFTCTLLNTKQFWLKK